MRKVLVILLMLALMIPVIADAQNLAREQYEYSGYNYGLYSRKMVDNSGLTKTFTLAGASASDTTACYYSGVENTFEFYFTSNDSIRVKFSLYSVGYGTEPDSTVAGTSDMKTGTDFYMIFRDSISVDSATIAQTGTEANITINSDSTAFLEWIPDDLDGTQLHCIIIESFTGNGAGTVISKAYVRRRKIQ